MSTHAFKIILELTEKQEWEDTVTAQHHPVRDSHLGTRIIAFVWAQLWTQG